MGDHVKLAVLGSTGSIGQQTLDIVRTFPDKFKVIGLAAGYNNDLFMRQVNEFKPQYICLNKGLNPASVYTSYQQLSIEEIASHPDVEIVVIATPGKVGLQSLLTAIKSGKQIALANKESLVMAGEIIIQEISKRASQILPVDSEHSAIWQCLDNESQLPKSIILTASGGPFLNYSIQEMVKVTVEQALDHPSWHMGNKVTIDSATLMNKGLEVIEAHWLFNIPIDSIRVVIHPQSIIHSMIEFIDGSLKAQLSYPDMRLPIQYALTYPKRIFNPNLPRINWGEITKLTFLEPDFNKFPCLKLAIEAGKMGGTYPAVLCASDEEVVNHFLSRQISFVDIPKFIEMTLSQHQASYHPDLEQIIAADTWARNKTRELLGTNQ